MPRSAWIPAGILAVTALAAWLVRVPDSLLGLRLLGPYVLLTLGAAVAWRFNRGRAFVMLASLLGAFAAWHAWPVKAVYAALAVIVPFNIVLALARAEIGARYRASYWWFALLAAEGLLLGWLAGLAQLPWLDWLLFSSPPVPLAGRLAFAAAFALAVWRAWPDAAPLQVGMAGALVAWLIAVWWVGMPGVYSAFMAAAAAILVVAQIEESHRLAFNDTLTGLPGRRALEERMRSLAGKYAIAMVDVDHFKKFNDTHGHDIGDQVLRLVGAQLAQVGGGGLAYRYGGEEFSVLFPDQELADVLPHLEDLRGAIQGYRMAVRAAGRPKSAKGAEKLRGEAAADKHLSVTVSIGAAGPDKSAHTPAQVIKAADEALYRAKQGGRNKVSV